MLSSIDGRNVSVDRVSCWNIDTLVDLADPVSIPLCSCSECACLRRVGGSLIACLDLLNHFLSSYVERNSKLIVTLACNLPWESARGALSIVS